MMIRSKSVFKNVIAKLKLAAALALGIAVFGCGGAKKTAQPEPDVPAPIVFDEPTTQTAEPTQPENPVTAPVEMEPTVQFRLQRIHFEFDQFDLTGEALQILSDNARVLKAYPDANVLIEGHCDERGTVEYNLALGDKRARAARDYLVSLGISPSRISVISYGKERPLDYGHNEQAWYQNRRSEFVRK
ncbi:MAG: peptidoglycan-associated lipoprotein Pal [Deferribacteres bacterium]|nr:peptidoglycan-associated lipoprotein Pal [candidate division KSB1 bacterium]MCB9508933.1 peptidoglycan-associated lipoprotein Pal [Deferribacteres bacterium]